MSCASDTKARYTRARVGESDLTVFCPFTRTWAVEPFFDALTASDIPFTRAHFVAYVDSSDASIALEVECRALALPFAAITVHLSGWTPPDEREKAMRRRTRHACMRLASRAFIPKSGELLLLEDDTIIPPETYEPMRAMREYYDWVSGVQVGRWDFPCIGLWKLEGKPPNIATTLMPEEQDPDATGLFCVLTDSSIYRLLDPWVWDQAMGHDVTMTYRLSLTRKLGVCWDVETGHLMEDGTQRTVKDAKRLERVYDWNRPMHSPSGAFWPRVDVQEVETMPGEFYVPQQRVVRGGTVLYGKRFRGKDGRSGIPMKEALELAAEGLISDPNLTMRLRASGRGPSMAETHSPVEETKPADESKVEVKGPQLSVTEDGAKLKEPEPKAKGFPCDECDFVAKSASGLKAHKRAKHG